MRNFQRAGVKNGRVIMSIVKLKTRLDSRIETEVARLAQSREAQMAGTKMANHRWAIKINGRLEAKLERRKRGR